MKQNLKSGGDSLQIYFWLFLGIFLVYIVGAFMNIMDIDAAQYASISRDMAVSGEYLQVSERSKDYLDKPPLLFWFTAFAFSLLGVSNFVYRLFPILSSILGIYATYRLGKLFYGNQVGKLAALILASGQAYFLFNHDVRTDTMLTNSVIFAIWQLAEFNQSKKWLNLLGGFVGIGLAMLAKGPIGLMVPVLAFSTDFILKRKFAWFFRWQWLLGLMIVAIILFPMCYGLYLQFDIQPEKVVNGEKNVSGLYFYFWKQSFGRLTGENVWKDDTDSFFFIHTFIWSFLPWALLFFPGLYQSIAKIIKQRFKISIEEEALTLGGFILPFIALSRSHYKLPHYIYVLFPLAAIIMAKFLAQIIYQVEQKRAFNITNGVQIFVVCVLWLVVPLLGIICFPMQNIFNWLIISSLFIGSFYFIFKSINRFQKIILPSTLTILGANFLLNVHVYPTLLKYQAGSEMATYARYETKADSRRLYAFFQDNDREFYGQSLDFYSATHIAGKLTEASAFLPLAKKDKIWIYTNENGLKSIEKLAQNHKVLKDLPFFHITGLTLPFLNPQTRAQELGKVYLLEFSLKK